VLIESQEGKGTRVALRLPVRRREDAPPATGG
jgi:signal transduction histidine kinase